MELGVHYLFLNGTLVFGKNNTVDLKIFFGVGLKEWTE